MPAPDRAQALQTLSVADLGEHALIQRITARLVMPSWVVVGPGDDAAVVAPARGTLDVLTTDAQVEGVHFDRRIVPPEAIGHRALAVNLSDLAAMGAEPRMALLSLILPDALEVAALDRLIDGLLALAAAHRVAIVGGNITRSPGPLVVDVTACGAVRPRRVLPRSGARSGDEVFVTGSLGDAAVGLEALLRGRDGETDGDSDPSAFGDQIGRYLQPAPRVRAGLLLGRNRAATSCIDLSDGLGDGVRQIAAASGVGITIDAGALPIGEGVRRWHDVHGSDPIATALAGGDDYELLFTAGARHQRRLHTVRRQIGELPITRIGVVTKGRDLLVKTPQGLRELPGGYEHFR